MPDDILSTRLEHISDFVKFEAGTSAVWPWATPAEELLQQKDKLLAAAEAIHFDADGGCDTDEMYEALERVFGINPALLEPDQHEDGMTMPEM